MGIAVNRAMIGDEVRPKRRSAAETLISASRAAQEELVQQTGVPVIPAVAESPIPVLAPRNRTPDPRHGTGRTPRKAG
ncbi:MAG TPA: hypothetical protein VNQ78_03715 [Paracoccus sp. (in: a-proteobacteria)]|uniref:hypothetical protein n=1 Tax=Paracoccus sp. TaxID=267 RepID=UPI002C1527BF|nr:hypothetical protein [Paracoccus sp. (in: a-proteobacteria)]HWL55765.1 hypothetical protein [Paracoccus sp. (in: a-proteobacteria)]